MSNFNFGSLQTTNAVSTSSPRLKPWGIYPVKFAGCRVDDIQGKKDPSQHYKILKVRFEGEEGYYEESIFFPKESDGERRTFQNKEGHDYQTPSNFEQIMTVVGQIGGVLNPEGYKKMQEASSKFRSFDDVCKFLIAITDPVKGTETNLKLIGKNRDGQVVPAIPRICAINKQGELFTSGNFIGDKLFFSDYEIGQVNAYHNAKPTEMPGDASTLEVPEVTSAPSTEDIDALIAGISA